MKKPQIRSRSSESNPTDATKKKLINTSKDYAYEEQQALSLIKQKKLQEAEKIYRSLIAVGTNNHIVYGNLAAICGIQGRYDETINLLHKTLELKPNDPEAHYNLGIALQKQDNLKAAIDSYKKAIQLKLNYPEAHNNLGFALKMKGDLEAAIDSYKQAIQLNPSYPEALYNLGIALKDKGDLEAAIASYKQAIKLKPNYPGALYNLSAMLLLSGDYKSGWKGYAHRFQSTNDNLSEIANCSQWKGKPLKAKDQLLLVSEQGLGDTLQFMRYALALMNKGIAVSLTAQPNLHSLIQASGIDPSPLTHEQAKKVSWGQWSPLLSVPSYLDVSPDNPIITEPYISTTEELIAKWKDVLAREKRPIIGINWQGNPTNERTTSKGRSLPLETFAPIAQHSNASLLSLQKGFGSEQLDTCSFEDRFVKSQNLIKNTWDFLETAAIIANCDLIITSDTSVAHLAGGMGQTTWLLLKKVPEWRWGLEEDTSFWYPSMRLFRQKERGNWDEVMERVTTAIKKKFPINPESDYSSS